MKLSILGSSSKGNCYILENEHEALIIECGIKFDQVKIALNFNLKKVVGCLLTHNHGDHAEYMYDFMKGGINVYSGKGTFDALNINWNYAHRAIPIMQNSIINIGNFKVMAFDVKHDAAEPLGFLINHEECGNVLFLTDSYYCEYTFRNLNNIIIEANYCQTILDDRLARGTNPKFLRDRVLQSHMSLATCKKTLSANDLSQVNNIVLIHLSDGNSDANRFKREVQEETGKVVHVAYKNQIIPFNKNPF